MRPQIKRLAVLARRDMPAEPVRGRLVRVPVIRESREGLVHRARVRSCTRAPPSARLLRRARGRKKWGEEGGARYSLTIIAAPRQVPMASTVS